MKSLVQFTKIRDVKSPNRAHSTDAGTDFFIPNYSKEFIKDLLAKNVDNYITMKQRTDENGETFYEFTIPSHEQINIPSGIRVNIIDKNTYLQATNKSGVASKFHLDVMANTIDADYQGEVHLNLVNTGNKPITIRTGQKIVQFIHKEYLDTVWSEISNEEYDMIETSDRSTGGFGSSGIQ